MATLRELRQRRYLTQRDMAEMIGVSDITVAAWESGRTKPRLRKIPRIAEALGVDPSDVEQAIAEQEQRQGGAKAA